ncbi:MAG: quinol dehydrogenase ferredoxin subunit NapH [Bacteroidales bacterium]|nr:quinol dehydrogenase ferredoxin subunit NapH [Bacteroidales bacterium]
MNKVLKNNKFLILRRIIQISILLLFVGGNYWGWNILRGDLSTAKVLDTFYLSDPYFVIQTFASGFVVAADVLVGALIILLFYALIGGRAFCSWVCPMNIITDSANRLRKILKMYREDVKVPINRNLRYWILGLSIVLSALFGVAAFEAVSPISMLHRGIIFGMGFGWAAILLVFFFDLFVLQNGWCGYVCPLGAFYSLTNKIKIR